MNASNELVPNETSPGGLQPSGDVKASAGFSSLGKSRQVLIFQTIEEAISAVPPRLEATFPRVVAAYTSLAKVVEAAAQGQLLETDLAKLEKDIDAAGGVIAPGLWSQGENSISVFRTATFGALRNNFQPAVVDAALAALNAKLSILKINDLGRVFQAIAAFFSPLSPSGNNKAKLQAFNNLDVERQILVFRTIQDASLANPQRNEATFSTVVDAFYSEVKLLQHACEGTFSDDLLLALEADIEAAGGVLSPNTYASGKRSIASFRRESFKALQSLLPAEVMASAVSALNARLRDVRPTSLPSLFTRVQGFFAPLLAQGWTSPTLQNFKGLAPHLQSLVFRTVETAMGTNPELESTIFSSAVKAICAEQEILHAAKNGQLTPLLLSTLKDSIDLCGGFVEPGLKSEGEDSVGEFIEAYFTAIQRDTPAEVSAAAISALNAKLQSSSSVASFHDIVQETKKFLGPVINVLKSVPLQSANLATETLPQSRASLIEESRIIAPLDEETPFQSTVLESTDDSPFVISYKSSVESSDINLLSDAPEQTVEDNDGGCFSRESLQGAIPGNVVDQMVEDADPESPSNHPTVNAAPDELKKNQAGNS